MPPDSNPSKGAVKSRVVVHTMTLQPEAPRGIWAVARRNSGPTETGRSPTFSPAWASGGGAGQVPLGGEARALLKARRRDREPPGEPLADRGEGANHRVVVGQRRVP